jgi:hypothetical protein
MSSNKDHLFQWGWVQLERTPVLDIHSDGMRKAHMTLPHVHVSQQSATFWSVAVAVASARAAVTPHEEGRQTDGTHGFTYSPSGLQQEWFGVWRALIFYR